MKIVKTVAELAAALEPHRVVGCSVGLVPTMGALHEGHISLIDKARADNETVVVSVFVNPNQFNDPKDYESYPRAQEADTLIMKVHDVDIAFMPGVEDIYPERDTRVFNLSPEADVMEGPMRPGHFNGVAQVVSKLFDMVKPTRAYFGEKDYQQIAVINRMCKSLYNPPQIIPVPICRANSGLALSSRNNRLTPEQCDTAAGIYRALKGSLAYYKEVTPAEVQARVVSEIDAIPGLRTEYYDIVDAETLQPIKDWSRNAQGCVTVWCGDVRLIDNIRYPKA